MLEKCKHFAIALTLAAVAVLLAPVILTCCLVTYSRARQSNARGWRRVLSETCFAALVVIASPALVAWGVYQVFRLRAAARWFGWIGSLRMFIAGCIIGARLGRRHQQQILNLIGAMAVEYGVFREMPAYIIKAERMSRAKPTPSVQAIAAELMRDARGLNRDGMRDALLAEVQHG